MATIYITAVGRRKTAIASVRMTKAEKPSVIVNGKSAKEYFKTDERAKIAEEALAKAESAENYAVVAHVEGGGVAAQADALRTQSLAPSLRQSRTRARSLRPRNSSSATRAPRSARSRVSSKPARPSSGLSVKLTKTALDYEGGFRYS